jgi:hypothetical protein
MWKDTRPKKMYHLDWIVGASPDLDTVNSAPEEVYETVPAVVFQFVVSAPVVKSWVYVLDVRAVLAGQAEGVSEMDGRMRGIVYFSQSGCKM